MVLYKKAEVKEQVKINGESLNLVVKIVVVMHFVLLVGVLK